MFVTGEVGSRGENTSPVTVLRRCCSKSFRGGAKTFGMEARDWGPRAGTLVPAVAPEEEAGPFVDAGGDAKATG